MKNNKNRFKPTCFLTNDQRKADQKRTVAEIFEWLETTLEFLDKFRTIEAKAFNERIRRGEI